MAGKNMVGRGRGSRGLRAVFAGRAVWLLPKLHWAFSGGEGCEPGAHFARRAVTCNHQVRRWLRWTTTSGRFWFEPAELRFQAFPGFGRPVWKRPDMHDEKTVQRFIELRSQGWTRARLMSPVQDWQG